MRMAAPTNTPSMSMMCDCSIGHGLSDGDERTRSWDRSDDAGVSATSGRAAWLAHQNGDRSSHGLPLIPRECRGASSTAPQRAYDGPRLAPSPAIGREPVDGGASAVPRIGIFFPVSAISWHREDLFSTISR